MICSTSLDNKIVHFKNRRRGPEDRIGFETKTTILIACVVLLFSCARKSDLIQINHGIELNDCSVCNKLYSAGSRQYVHMIEGTMPGGRKGFLMGVTTINTNNRSIHCVMLTLEGMVLLDAQRNSSNKDKLAINRAVPPFDNPNFVQGLMDDIAFVYFPPDIPFEKAVRFENGTIRCRFASGASEIVDIVYSSSQSWEILQYNEQGHLTRKLKNISDSDEDTPGSHVAGKMILTGYNDSEYSLILTLTQSFEIIE